MLSVHLGRRFCAHPPPFIANEVSPAYFGAENTGEGVVYVSFETDGAFEATAPLGRRLEFIGDSITAATNVLAHTPCGDSGLQSSFHQSYSALLALNLTAEVRNAGVGVCGMK